MANELKEGVQLKRVVTLPDPQDGCAIYRVGDQRHECASIVVTEESGQLAPVPWARCEGNSGEVVLVNLANVESVTLA